MHREGGNQLNTWFCLRSTTVKDVEIPKVYEKKSGVANH